MATFPAGDGLNRSQRLLRRAGRSLLSALFLRQYARFKRARDLTSSFSLQASRRRRFGALSPAPRSLSLALAGLQFLCSGRNRTSAHLSQGTILRGLKDFLLI